jgi:two-component system response regulator YesN
MPQLDGLEVMKRLRKKGINLIVYVISGYNEFEYARQMLKMGVTDYISKPLDRKDICGIGMQIAERIEKARFEHQKRMENEKRANMFSLVWGSALTKSIERQISEKINLISTLFVRRHFSEIKLMITNTMKQLQESGQKEEGLYFGLKFAAFLYDIHQSNNLEIGTDHMYQNMVLSHENLDQLGIWLCEQLDIAAQASAGDAADRYYYALLKLIECNYYKDINLNSLAETIAVSPNYLGRIFKERASMGVAEYIRKKRISKALELMTGTNLKINYIAEKVGFSDQHYFSKVFKEETGKTPSEYRS